MYYYVCICDSGADWIQCTMMCVCYSGTDWIQCTTMSVYVIVVQTVLQGSIAGYGYVCICDSGTDWMQCTAMCVYVIVVQTGYNVLLCVYM